MSWTERHDWRAPNRAFDAEFRDYTPPPAHHRHTYRVNDRPIPMGHEPTESISEAEAARRLRQIGLTSHNPTGRSRAARTARKQSRLEQGMAEAFGEGEE